MKYRLALALAALIALFELSCGGEAATPTPAPRPTPTPAPATATPVLGGGAVGDVVKVENQDIGGSGEYKFVPSEFHFEVGQTVTFAMMGETEYHTFTVDDLGIDEDVNAGETVTFTHTFDTAGEFELICIPHQPFGMIGIIVVE